MNYYLLFYRLALYLTSFTSLSLGIIVFLKAYRTKSGFMFATFTTSVALWSFSHAQMSFAKTPDEAILWARILQAFVVIIPCVFLHFTYAIVENEKEHRKIILFAYSGCLIFLLLLFSRLFIKSVIFLPNVNYMFRPGIAYHFFLIFYITLLVFSFYNLYEGYKTSTGLRANQLKYVLLGTFIGFFSASSNFQYVYNITLRFFNPYATFGVPLYAFIITYAILKHRLMDINLIFRKTVIYGLTYSLCLGLFSFVVILFGQSVIHNVLDIRVFGITMIGVLIIVLSVKPLDRLLTILTDKFLFHKKYEYHQTLKAASLGMISVRKLDKLLNLIVAIITKHVRVKQATIFLLDKGRGNFIARASKGKLKVPKDYLKLNRQNPLVKYLLKNKDPIVCEELKLMVKQNYSQEASRIIEEMERFNVSLCVPSFLKGRLIGLLLLGEKLSGDMYTQEDLSLFNTLSIQAALAIENAQAYEELSETKDKLFEAEKFASIGRLAGGIAHEIKNPLASIKTFTEYMNKKFDNPEFRAKFQRIVGSEVDRINHIVEQLIFYAHPKSAHLRETNLHEIIDATLSLLENEITKERIHVKKNYSPECGMIISDPQQLEQVFLNLFLNSIQAMHNNKETEKELKISTSRENGSIKIIISDTGTGIPQDLLPKIFEPFFTTKEKGSGLGLAIVKSIIENHKGKIYAESLSGSKTTFSIIFPAKKMPCKKSFSPAGHYRMLDPV
ncbi:MAG: GAF domain-containing protein [Candidatus Omnitrophica bacterium]|nr:GAF domain-containing protein [Candidatus Omnitrophota bacterium]